MLQPTILLSHPQMHENIGATARAMGNFSLDDLRIIKPRDGKPSEISYKMASGADWVLDQTSIYDDFNTSVADLNFIIATSARHRDMAKPVMSPEDAIAEIYKRIQNNQKCGILFGGERAGLANEEIVHADILVKIPTNPDFSSLNLGQSVLLMGYEWFKQSQNMHQSVKSTDAISPYPAATQKDMYYFHEHLEQELDKKGFFFPTEKKASMVQTLKNLFIRADMNEQEVRTMRGVIKTLSKQE